MIARLEVTRGCLTEYPLAEKVRGGWQNGATFYPDAEVTKVTVVEIRPACLCTPAIAGISDGPNVECPLHGEEQSPLDALTKYLDWLPSHIEYVPVADIRSRMAGAGEIELS